MLLDEYAGILRETIEKICRTERGKISEAAAIVSGVIQNDGLIYVFGCGHSHILAEETFYRAGGLACVAPVFSEPLMLHESAFLSSSLEKAEGYYETLFKSATIGQNDALICVSTSGVNAVPVEYASAVRKDGVPVIGISSDDYLAQEAHNPLGKHLQEVCDVCINNYAPHGDACLQLDGLPVKMTPVSTVSSAFVINSILAEGTQMAIKEGAEVPVYMSGNIPGGAEYNRALVKKYKDRIHCL